MTRPSPRGFRQEPTGSCCEVSLELQQEFYDAHRAELEGWLAAYQEFQAQT